MNKNCQFQIVYFLKSYVEHSRSIAIILYFLTFHNQNDIMINPGAADKIDLRWLQFAQKLCKWFF